MSEPQKAIFLSYAREDTDAARRIADALRSQGLEVWFDQNELRGGDTWDQKIRHQIGECSLFLPIVSRHTQGRSKGYFRLEWKLAVEQTHQMAEGVPFLAPIAIDDTSESGAVVPPEFMRVQWTRLPGALPTPQFVEQVQRLLAPGQVPLAKMEPGRPRPALRDEGVAPPVKPRVPGWIWGAVAALVVGAGAFFALRPATKEPAASTSGSNLKATPQPAKLMDLAAAKSIAVLAFADLSAEKDGEYFADGISEELLNVLAKVPGLKVSARTSAFHFKGKDTLIPEIARQLGVAYIVEGSVRKVGNRVRITAQLIKAADQFHVWSENFDRDLKDIFAVQDEIAGLIAKNLSLKLGTSTPAGPVNPDVFRLYLEGRHEWNKRTEEGLAKAQTFFERAIALDPKFARAYAGLADVWVVSASRFPPDSDRRKEFLTRARAETDRALALDANLAEAHAAQATVLSFEGHYDAGEAAFRHALALNPNYASAHQWHGLFLFGRGKIEAGLAELAMATQLDPLSPVIASAYGLMLNHARRWTESLAACDRALAIQPDFEHALVSRAQVLIGLNRRPEALSILRPLIESTKKSSAITWRAISGLAQAGDGATAEKLARPIFADPAQASPNQVFELYLALNRTEEGFAFLERNKGRSFRDPGYCVAAVYDGVRDDPRFLRALEEAGVLAEYREAWAQVLAWKKKTGQR